jgi:hypothetical protein
MRALHLLLLLPAWLPMLAGLPRAAPTSHAEQNTSLSAHAATRQDPPHTASGQAAPDAPPVRADGGHGPTSPRSARAAFLPLDKSWQNTHATAAAVAHERLRFVYLLLRSCTGLFTNHSSTAPPDLQD